MQNARHLIEHLLAKGKLEAAIEGCLILCRHYADQERGASAAQQSARYHTLMTDFHNGTLSNDDYRIEWAEINRAMLDLAQGLPAAWTDEALQAAGFSPTKYDRANAPAPAQNFLEKWGLVLGIVASIATILGITLQDVWLPGRQQEKVEKTDSTQVKPKPQADGAHDPKTGPATPNTEKPAQEPSQEISRPRLKEKLEARRDKVPKLLDGKFRSFAQMRISDGMELGYMDGKLAFRNVRTHAILCCFADAEDFANGKAYVSKDGVNYYYTDTAGNRVE